MSDFDRLSQGPSTVRKGLRAPPPTYRNDANFGRASGKIINIGTVAKDADGFEDFGAYLNDDVFLSPPPSIPSKPKPKAQQKKSTGNTRVSIDSNDDRSILDESLLSRRVAPEPPKKSSQTRTLTVTATTSTSRNRPAIQPTSAVDYDSIPEPSTKRKTLSQSTSGKAASSSSNNRPTSNARSSQQTSTTSRNATATAKSNSQGKQAAALSTIAEDESDDDMDEQDGNGDSNMSLVSVVNEDQAAESHAGRFNLDDEDSGNEDFEPDGGDNDGGMDVDEPDRDPTPEAPRPKANDKARRNRIETPSDEEMEEPPFGRDDEDMAAPDDDGQFDVGGGYDEEPQQEEDQEEREPSESPRSKRARLAQEKKEKQKEKANQKREPLKPKDPNAQPKKTKRNFEPQSDDDDNTGVRRGKRQRFAPLQWWRGEHAVVRRPRAGEAPVPIISEIVRIPEEQPEPLSKRHRRRGTTKPPSSRNDRNNSKQGEVWVDNPEEGWDAETEQNAMVIDYDTKQEMEKVIAQTAAMLNPKQPLNASYAFQKVFSDGEFVAGGVLEIPVGGKKPSKPARDNTYLFYCIDGAVRVMVHRSTFVIARNGMFMVPRGNQYYLENIGDRDCKLFFAQARKVTEKMVPSPTKRASMNPAGRDASASQTPRPVARAGLSTASGSPSKTKKIGTSKR